MVCRIYSFTFFLLLSLSMTVLADIQIPAQLDSTDRSHLLEILGYGTAGKLNSNPYPLGGYYGIEVGLVFEFIDLENIDGLGSGADNNDQLIFPTFSFGKGLYGNIDLFFYFTPFLEDISVSRYGGFMRWGFFQSNNWPLNLSLLLHSGGANIDNKVSTETYSYSLVSSFHIWELAVYAGLGELTTKGEFIGGGISGVTDTGNTESERLKKIYSLFGVGYVWEIISVNFEVNHAHNTTYSLNLAFKF